MGNVRFSRGACRPLDPTAPAMRSFTMPPLYVLPGGGTPPEPPAVIHDACMLYKSRGVPPPGAPAPRMQLHHAAPACCRCYRFGPGKPPDPRFRGAGSSPAQEVPWGLAGGNPRTPVFEGGVLPPEPIAPKTPCCRAAVLPGGMPPSGNPAVMRGVCFA